MDRNIKKRNITVKRGGTTDYRYQSICVDTIYKSRNAERLRIRVGECEGSLQVNGRTIVEDDSRLSFSDWVEIYTGVDLDTLQKYATVGRY